MMSAREMFEEFNKMYGTDIEFPESYELEERPDFDMEQVAFDMAMGMSFDAATQKDMI